MKPTKSVVHFIWLLPYSKDSNRHIRQMMMSEAAYCETLDIEFYSAESYKNQSSFDSKYPDLVILFGSFYQPCVDIYSLIYRIKSTANAYIAAWTTDDPYEFDCNYFLPKLVDFVFSNDKNSCNYYHSENTWHIPLAASEEVHGKPESSKHPDWDFVFCGVGFSNRIDIIEGLLDVLKNYSTLIIGSGWSSQISSNLTVRASIDYEELLSIYRNTKIVLNLSRSFDLKNKIYEIIPSTPAPRTFEVAAMGVFQMIFLDKPEIYEYFDRDEFVSFSSKLDFLNLSKKYLQDTNLRNNIAIKARQRVFKEHFYRHRLETIANLVFSHNKSDKYIVI